MEYERLPSGIFFNLRQQDIHVEPPIHRQSRHDPWSDPFVPNLLPSVESKRSGLQEHREFRLASASIAKDDDRRYLPLLEVSVDVNVVATISRTRLTQTFSNHSNITIKEATYCFPLYDGSAVIAFLCWIGNNKRLEGKVKPKEAAKAEFLEAVNRQHAAVLLEEITPEVFETCLGNIPPQATVKVEITYINELKADLGGNGVLVTIPTSVAPRYGTPPVGYTHGSASRSTVTPAENGLGIQVEVFAPVPIHKLESRTHPISVELGHPSATNSIRDLVPESPRPKFDPRKARATLSDRTTTLAKDFVLLILAEDRTILASRALLEPHPSLSDRSALMVTINPQELFSSGIVIDKVKTEIVFVADRSGSMCDKIEALISAMRVFLKSIPQGCYLNICSFGSSHSLLWPESRQYTQENLDLATQHVTHSFASDMGGTELLSALRHVVEKRNARQEMTTEVIVLTDGEVWDTEQVIKFVQETRTKTEERVRFFALGIGDAVSHRLVEGIGRQGGGFAEVVAVDTGGRWESRVIRMLKGALMPSTWQCEITLREENDTSGEPMSTKGVVLNNTLIPQPPILQAPNRIPPLHTFLRSSVYFLVDPQVLSQTKSITVQAIASSGERAKLDIPLEQVEAQPPTIHHLAGKALMNDLEIGQSWMHVDKYQKYRSKDPVTFEQAVQQEAENVGIKWCIAGKWTSFVAVDNNDQAEQNARIYRAGRCDLADLTRQRWVTRQPNSANLPRYSCPSSDYVCDTGYGDADGSRPFDNFRMCGPATASNQRAIALSRLSSLRSSSWEDHCSANVPSTTGYLDRGDDRSEGGEGEDVVSAECVAGSMAPTDSRRESVGGRTSIYRERAPIYPEWASMESGWASIDSDRAPIYNEKASIGSKRASTIPGRAPIYNEEASIGSKRAPTKPGRVKETRAPSQEITLDDLIGLQTSSGSFAMAETGFRLRLMRHFSHEVISEMDQCIKKVFHWTIMRRAKFRAIRDTILIVAFIKFQYPESAELWELVVLKARGWVGRSLGAPDVLTELEKIARDNIDSASSAMPATGSSDVSTTPLKPARSTDNTEIVAEKTDGDNFKEHAVGSGAEIDTVVEAKSG